MMRYCLASLAALTLVAGAAERGLAQGNLSAQGFGYPPGQLPSRVLGMGGATIEADPQAPVNPAAHILWGAPVLFLQYEPEFRRVRSPSGSTRTMTARFPMVGFSIPIGSRWATAVTVSTYLDRTWATRSDRPQLVGTDTVTVTQRFSSDGSINDVRLALGYALTPRFSLGLGAHVFTGENRISVEQIFPDTVVFSDLIERSDLSYGGTALSAGFDWRPARWQLGGSIRRGGEITAESGDSTISRGRLPFRYGFGVGYMGIAGVTLAARASHEEWSSLRPLGSADLTAFDAWDIGIGAEGTGPRIGRRVLLARAGLRHRTLPFGADGAKVTELSLSAGLGIPIALNRAHLDIGLARAARDADRSPSGTFGPAGARGEVKETAYILSMGIRVRP